MEPSDSLNSATDQGSGLPASIPDSLPLASILPNEHPCSYLPGRLASLPLILPSERLSLDAFDAALAAGMRRAGYFLYFVQCSRCRACQPTRLDVNAFRWTDSWRRIRNRGNKSISVSVAPVSFSEEKLVLFNRHRNERGLSDLESDYREEDYEGFLVESSCQYTLELQFRLAEELIAVSVIDCGTHSASAVYTYFNPDFSKFSLGTFSILKQIEFCQSTGRQYLYLGMYVSENSHLSYKARFLPQQRWVDEKWIDIDSD